MSSEGASGSAMGGQLEEKADLSAETDAKLEQSQTLVQAGQLPEALVLLAALEKRCRVGNDNTSLARVCEASLKFCKEAGDEEALLLTLETLSTRRSQKTSAIKALVTTAIPWCVVLPYTPLPVTTAEQKVTRDKLVEALRVITDGKIFLEKERAQLTRALATIKVSSFRCVWFVLHCVGCTGLIFMIFIIRGWTLIYLILLTGRRR
jgi:26S proteasome regulatory subunit N5